jgi:tRNA nucleotidyltransferase (CCA-adding enzyme)
LGSFENVLKKITKLQNNEMIGESPRKFESPIVIIDPIDRNRNLGAAISIQNLTNFILIARNFLKKNSISYFKPKKKSGKATHPISKIVIIHFKYKKRSNDIIYGQIKRAASSIESQLNKGGFNVLRTDSFVYDENKACLLFLLESLTINKDEIRTGPDVFSSEFASEFININVKKSHLMWTDKDGKLQSLVSRKYDKVGTYLNALIKNHMGELGIPKGLRSDFKAGVRIIHAGASKQQFMKLFWENKPVFNRASALTKTDDRAFSTN